MASRSSTPSHYDHARFHIAGYCSHQWDCESHNLGDDSLAAMFLQAAGEYVCLGSRIYIGEPSHRLLALLSFEIISFRTIAVLGLNRPIGILGS